MFSIRCSRNLSATSRGLKRMCSVVFVLVLLSYCAWGQSTVATGSIQGTVTDQTGAVVAGAKVTIKNNATDATIHVTASTTGSYSTGPIQPGDYLVRVEEKGFKTMSLAVTVQVGNTATANLQMQLGQESQVVEVQGSSVAVNTEQATVQGTINVQQIENLPVNGRNFLDLAQLEPGVQIQEGSTFDPTKNGFSSISFEGRFGRTARIEVDGVDVSDETVGTTTQNIPASAIQEFQLSQSSLDLSTELTSSGAVNVTTRSGTNSVHGEAFGFFRGNQIAAALPGPTVPPFQREQFGGNLGGAIVKDKLFWFLDGERTKQDLTAAEPFSAPFSSLNTTLVEPYREFNTDGRIDWNARGNARAFYRFNFDQNSDIRPFGSASSLQGFRNADHTATHVVGVDFNTGALSQSLRFEYLKFRNGIGDGTSIISAGPDNPIPGLGINIGAPIAGSCVISRGGGYCGGPNLLAPQQTIQSDHEIKYDASKVFGRHIIRFGATFNHIQGGGLAAFFTFPQVGTTNVGTSSDPTSYPADYVFLGNGIGFPTAKKAFNFPAGGLGPDNRVEAYVGDVWKLQPRLTLSLGLRYVRDTGRVDSDLGPLPALNAWGAGLGDQVRTPSDDFAPQVGVAWDVTGSGKTVLRAGGGLFYENSIWNNVLFDSPARIPQGIFSATPLVCGGGVASPFPWPSNPGPAGSSVAGGAGVVVAGGNVSPTFCGGTIATVAPQILALSSAFKAAAATVGQIPNPNFVGSALNASNINGFDLFAPNYQTPRSWQMNIGIQHQFHPGTVLSADFIRNVDLRSLLVIDVNHSGAARSFNHGNALAARDAAQTGAVALGAANNCPAGSGQGACMVAAFGGGAAGLAGAQAAYSASGLDSNVATAGGGPCSFCAFPGTDGYTGVNDGALGVLDMLMPVGRAVYNGLQVKLVQQVKDPVRGVKRADFQVSYSLSKYVSQVQDGDFVNLAVNNDNATQFTGPNALDRTHQISFGGTFDLPAFVRLSLIGHFYSPLPQNLALPQLTGGGEIFASDWLGSGIGSGAPGPPLPGTNLGQFARGTDIGNLQALINNYNGRDAGTLTPAGQQLVSSGVMTQADMNALAWVMPQIGSVAPGAVNFPWLKSLDFKASWPIKVKERLTIEPSASIFNIFNFANEFLPGNLPGNIPGTLSPSDPGCVASGNCATTVLASNSVGGVTPGVNLVPYRASFQSGTYALGAPRQVEFGLNIRF
ncbi:MAG TPA: carboxypeptidase-like regulatory domain-containing protein [Candidatus Sulfotelmatobacter sp.]